MNSSGQSWIFNPVGCPIRRSTDQRLLAASRGLSQLAASFIACWHQGIHRIALSSLITKVKPYCPSELLRTSNKENSANCIIITPLFLLPMCSCQRTPSPALLIPRSLALTDFQDSLKIRVVSSRESLFFLLSLLKWWA